MRGSRAVAAAAFWLAACVVACAAGLAGASLAGCAKAADQPRDQGPPKMPVAEQDRGLAMCRGYVARLCACAEKDPTLAETCALAKGQPEGLELHVQLLRKGGDKGPLNTEERVMTEIAARKIIAECARSEAALDPVKCPRAAALPDTLK